MGFSRGTVALGLILSLAACVTVNVYFPAAAAQEAADKYIEEVWGKTPDQGPEEQTPEPSSRRNAKGQPLAVRLLDLVFSPAQAAANIDIDTPAIAKIKASMTSRRVALFRYFDSGAVGLTADGLVTIRNPGAIRLDQRRAASQVVADENRDRNALYREIARANGRPEWEVDIRKTFARRWVANARSGWWFQGAGGWEQKK